MSAKELPGQARLLIKSILDEIDETYGKRIRKCEIAISNLAKRLEELNSYVQTVYAKTLTVSLGTVVREAFQYNVSQLENKIAESVSGAVRGDISRNMNELAKSIVELGSRIDGTERQLSQLEKVIGKIVESLNILAQSISELHEKVGEIGELCNKLQDKHNELSSSLGELRKEIGILQEKSNILERRISTVANTVVEIHDAVFTEEENRGENV